MGALKSALTDETWFERHKRFSLNSLSGPWVLGIAVIKLSELEGQCHILKLLSKLIIGPENADAACCVGCMIVENLLTRGMYLSGDVYLLLVTLYLNI